MKGKFREREERTEQQLNYLKTAFGTVPDIGLNNKAFFLMEWRFVVISQPGEGVPAFVPISRQGVLRCGEAGL